MNHEMPVKILTQKDQIEAGCFNLKAAISVCEEAFRDYDAGQVLFPDKVSVIFDQESQNRINCLPAAMLKQNVYGMKWVSVFPENPHKCDLPNLTAVIILSELEHGYPVAFMEGSLCSNLRTASVGALGAKYFARKNAKVIGLIGAGEQAKTHFLAMMEVCPEICVCKVSSRTRRSEQIFIEQMKKFRPDVQFIACESCYEKAIRDADIIITAISGQEQILKADWIKPGAFYCHVAGLEDEFAVAKKANKIVCDSWAVVKHRTQTISQMYARGFLGDNDIYADLHEVISGKKCGRETDDEFVYFNSVGLSYLDVSLSNWMYRKTVAAGKGTTIALKEKSMFDY